MKTKHQLTPSEIAVRQAEALDEPNKAILFWIRQYDELEVVCERWCKENKELEEFLDAAIKDTEYYQKKSKGLIDLLRTIQNQATEEEWYIYDEDGNEFNVETVIGGKIEGRLDA